MNSPTFTMKGYNPDMKDLTVEVKRSTSDGFGYALSQAIQFNVNTTAPPNGAIFVDPNNNGVITIELTSKHVIDDAWALFPISAEPISAIRLDIARSIAEDRKSVTFNIRTGDPGALIFTTQFVLQFAPPRAT
ncbi:hypothetical protein ACVWZ9_004001 [Pseudomonas chlororaphis]